MENVRLPLNIAERPGAYLCGSLVIFLYEFVGMFFIVGVINATKNNPVAVGISLFICLLLGGPITGGYYNPAVTLGVYINRIRTAEGRRMSMTI